MRVGAATVVTMALIGRPRLQLMQAGDDPRLRQVFDTLSVSDQYSVLLQTLVNSPGMYSSDRCTAIVDLVGEMSMQRVPLERKSLVALLDAALQDDGSDATLLRLFDAARLNGACRSFAACAPGERPSAAALAALPALPDDSRVAEAAGAAAAGLLATAAIVVHPPAAVVLPALTSGWAVDRYTQRGKWFELVARGLARLDQGPLSQPDLRSSCASDAASFLVGRPACCKGRLSDPTAHYVSAASAVYSPVRKRRLRSLQPTT